MIETKFKQTELGLIPMGLGGFPFRNYKRH